MSTWYFDTSAALKLIVEESESAALGAALAANKPKAVSCRLLETELRRAIFRTNNANQDDVTDLLARIDVYEVQPAAFRQAGRLPGRNLRSLDAIHLAVAMNIGVDTIVTYDARMTDSAKLLGFSVLAPM